MNEESDYGSKLVSDLVQIVEGELDIHQWGFQLSHTKLEKPGSQVFDIKLIYDSEWCRIKFNYVEVLGIPDRPHLLKLYGRLHAPNDTSIMVWNDEKCRCWHSVGGFTHLYFLDGFSGSETPKLWRTGRLPQVIKEFRESDLHTGPRSGIAEENAVWNHYGVRLFELFDLRRPDLWERYIHYLTELDDLQNEERRLKGKKSIILDPPQWRIC